MSLSITGFTRTGYVPNSSQINGLSQDWTKIPTKGASTLSKEEIMERISSI